MCALIKFIDYSSYLIHPPNYRQRLINMTHIEAEDLVRDPRSSLRKPLNDHEWEEAYRPDFYIEIQNATKGIQKSL